MKVTQAEEKTRKKTGRETGKKAPTGRKQNKKTPAPGMGQTSISHSQAKHDRG